MITYEKRSQIVRRPGEDNDYIDIIYLDKREEI